MIFQRVFSKVGALCRYPEHENGKSRNQRVMYYNWKCDTFIEKENINIFQITSRKSYFIPKADTVIFHFRVFCVQMRDLELESCTGRAVIDPKSKFLIEVKTHFDPNSPK